MDYADNFQAKTPVEKNGTLAGASSLPQQEHQLSHLLGILNNTISRYNMAISRYSIMNNHLTGVGKEQECSAVGLNASNMCGIVSELILRAEALHDLCADLDENNNRLNKIIVDGE